MDRFSALSPDMPAKARALFEAGQTLAAIAEALSVHRSTLTRWRKSGDWPERRRPRTKAARSRAAKSRPVPSRPAKAKAKPPTNPAEAGLEALDTLRLLRGVRKAVAHELATLREGATGEARARTLASLARTLDALRSVEGHIRNEKTGSTDHDDADEPPVDIAELRRELARRLDCMRGGGDAS